jgi:hypothetical protein
MEGPSKPMPREPPNVTRDDPVEVQPARGAIIQSARDGEKHCILALGVDFRSLLLSLIFKVQNK